MVRALGIDMALPADQLVTTALNHIRRALCVAAVKMKVTLALPSLPLTSIRNFVGPIDKPVSSAGAVALFVPVLRLVTGFRDDILPYLIG